MKLDDALTHLHSMRPINHRDHVTFDDFVLECASDPGPLQAMAQRVLDAEELFLPNDERTLSQLQNPRYRLAVDNLPPGITGEITNSQGDRWTTDSSTPYAMSTMYTRSPQ